MTPEALARLGMENLAATYLHLGAATPGARVEAHEGFTACTSPFDHAMGNFAVRLALDPWSARRLREIAAPHPAFQIYVGAGDGPPHVAEILERQGFRSTYRMLQMAAMPGEAGPPIALSPAEGLAARHRVAMFMGAQFFPRTPGATRQRLATAIAQASALDLHEVADRRGRVAAAMTYQSEGAFGLYNLCVAAPRRGKGIGRGVVAWARAEAAERGLPVVLQCDATLEGWYGALGFCRVCAFDVYILSKPQAHDIMN